MGDRPGGAEAWNADGDVEAAPQLSIDAYSRALAHRAVDDLSGRARDSVRLLRQYADRDEYRAAMAYAGLAYKLSNTLGDKRVSSYVLASVAALLFDMGALPAAEALVAEQDQVTDSSSPFFPNLCQLHGLINLAHGRYELARHDLMQAIELASKNGLHQIVRNAKLAIAGIDLEQHDLAGAARAVASDVLGPAENSDDRTHHAYVAARVELAAGHDGAALARIEGAIGDASPGWTGSLEALRGAALIHAQRPTEAERSLRLAVESSERRRADANLDELKPWLLRQEWRWPFEDLFRLYVDQHRWLDAFDIAQRVTARSVLDGLLTADRAKPGSIEDKLGDAGDRVEGLRTLTHSLRASAAAQPPTPTEVLAKLGKRVVFTYLRARGELWLIRSDATLSIERVATSAEVAVFAKRLAADPDDLVAATELGARLLPTRLLPPAHVPLYIVADESIAEVPFAALRVDGDVLIARNALAYEPSAAVLAQIVSSPLPSGRRLILGDPTNDLPDARIEAREVGAWTAAETLIGDAAKSPLLRGHAELLHIAAHTKRTSGGAVLALADRNLTAGDIIDAGAAIATVVLTSCESADLHDSAELGPLGLAFLAAGAHAVVASRWSVDDKVARAFARAFYAHDGAHHPIEATAAAQRELIREGAGTRSWATFVVFGDGIQVTKGQTRWPR